jgi:hypothetical protein
MKDWTDEPILNPLEDEKQCLRKMENHYARVNALPFGVALERKGFVLDGRMHINNGSMAIRYIEDHNGEYHG